jgi:hypothetical protein
VEQALEVGLIHGPGANVGKVDRFGIKVDLGLSDPDIGPITF